MKIISKEEAKLLGLKRYFTGKPCVNGHVDERLTSEGRCIPCKRITEKKKRRNNPDGYKERASRSYNRNKEKRLQSNKLYAKKRFSKSPELVRSLARNRMRKWMSVDENRASAQKSQRDRYQANPKKYIAKTKRYLDKNPHYVFIRRTIERIGGRSSHGKFNKNLTIVKCESALGYSRLEFINHIERQFQEGMSWGNRSEWHIDHIRPISSFLNDGITDLKVINALSNLRPLWPKDNLSKGSKY